MKVMKLKTLLFAGLASLSVAVSGIMMSASPAEAHWNCTGHMYRQGSRGECVRIIQTIHNEYVSWSHLSYFPGQRISEDGVFGPATKQAVRRLQRKTGVTADGIVGKNTWSKICIPLSAAGWRLPDGRIAALTDRRMYNLKVQAGCQKYFPKHIVYHFN